MLASRTNDLSGLTIFQCINLPWSNALSGDVGEIPQTFGEDRRGLVVIQWQEVSESGRASEIDSVELDALGRHRHLLAVPLECPSESRASLDQPNLKLSPPVDLIHDVKHGAELHGSAIQHQAGRPFVLTNGLVQQDQGLKDRGFS